MSIYFTGVKCPGVGDAIQHQMGPSKGFGRQATQSKNVVTVHFQGTNNLQKLLGNSQQFVTATNCMQHNQTNIQFQFLLKSDSDIWYNGTSDRAATKQATGNTGYPLGGPPKYLAINLQLLWGQMLRVCLGGTESGEGECLCLDVTQT